jgi:hypothetical protein
MSQMWKVFLACAFGAFIVALSAWRIDLAAARTACNLTAGWRPKKEYWPRFIPYLGVWLTLFIATGISISIFSLLTKTDSPSVIQETYRLDRASFIWMVSSFFGFVGLVVSNVITYSPSDLAEKRRVMISMNPFAIYLWYPIVLVAFIVYFGPRRLLRHRVAMGPPVL